MQGFWFNTSGNMRPPLKVPSDRLDELGIQLVTLGTMRVTYPLHHDIGFVFPLL